MDHLPHRKRTTERLFGMETGIVPHGSGPDDMRAAAHGALMGTHVRVGQEDNVTERPGVLHKSNAEQIRKVRRILRESAIPEATPAEARARLGLPTP